MRIHTMLKFYFIILFSLCFFHTHLASQEIEKTAKQNEIQDLKKEQPKEEIVATSHSIKIAGQTIPYKAYVGTQILNDDLSKAKASIFYIAYIRDDVEDSKTRPITFCFNGGPGASSIWLHLGTFGPKRVNIDAEGKVAIQPYHLLDNPYSLLDITDLVFIDPVSTGYSRAIPGEDPKQFHGVDEDVKSVAEFIRLYVTRNERWESPKFLAGESYGTTRAAGLAQELHDNFYLNLNGIFLISCVLNFQTIRFNPGNDLPYSLFLPTYTSTALYHKKLSDELQKNPSKTLEEAENFALDQYAKALMQGDRLEASQKKQIAEKLSKFTGLPSEYIENANLRVNIFRFARELLRNERRAVGRFDSRLKGIVSDLCGAEFEFDPSFENVLGLFTATFNEYIRSELNWKHDDEYKTMADVASAWNWNSGTATNQYLNVSEKLRDVMSKNPRLKVFVASGLTDLATPYYATDYTFAHLGIDPSLSQNITLENYEGGHMMYLYYPTLQKLKGDMAGFIKNTLSKESGVK